MAGNLSGQARVKCPFYISHLPCLRQVSCGGAARGLVVTLKFKTAVRQSSHMDRFCQRIDRWPYCPYARLTLLAHDKRCEKEGAPHAPNSLDPAETPSALSKPKGV